MLVLTRKTDQKIIFTTSHGEIIVLTVVAINGDRARLGIEADRSITIHREEVHRDIQRHGKRKVET